LWHTLNRSIWVSLLAVTVLRILVVNDEVLRGFFDTASLSPAQWALAILVGITHVGKSQPGGGRLPEDKIPLDGPGDEPQRPRGRPIAAGFTRVLVTAAAETE
jgi:hypothetical protein